MSNRTITYSSLLVLAVLVSIVANTSKAAPVINLMGKQKKVYVTNAHWNFLSIRCFSFDDSLGVQHLKPWQQFIFTVRQRVLYPTATMYNCSTNMGTFVVFKYNYECAQNDVGQCHWRFNLHSTSLYSPSKQVWQDFDYNPNYESLEKGGVVKGRYVN